MVAQTGWAMINDTATAPAWSRDGILRSFTKILNIEKYWEWIHMIWAVLDTASVPLASVWNKALNTQLHVKLLPPRIHPLHLGSPSPAGPEAPEPSQSQVRRIILPQPELLFNCPWALLLEQQCHCSWPQPLAGTKYPFLSVHSDTSYFAQCALVILFTKCRGFVFPSYCGVPLRIFFWRFHENTSQNTALISADISGELAEWDERIIYFKIYIYKYIYINVLKYL